MVNILKISAVILIIGIIIGVIVILLNKSNTLECKLNSDCTQNDICNQLGQCVKCTPDCSGKQGCESDGCNGKCKCLNGIDCPSSGVCETLICISNSDCTDNQICKSGKCVNKNVDTGYYCQENKETHLNECILSDTKLNSPGPYADNTCGNMCENGCGNLISNLCNDGATCLNDKCTSCSLNKLNITNASNETRWYFSYTSDKEYAKVPIWYYNDGTNIYFQSDTSPKWYIKNINTKDNTFDLDQTNNNIWKNFKLGDNNVYISTDYTGEPNKSIKMSLYPQGC